MTSEIDDTREGKGRVHPGPSPSSEETLSRRRPDRVVARVDLTVALGAFVVLVATVASSVFGTQAHQFSSPGAMTLVSALGSFAGIVLALGMPKERPAGTGDWLPAMFAGAGGFALAPWLVMANRATDAPPGSEVLFLTTASWGALLALALALGSRARISRAGGALLAVAGAAALVANWERPSSFSPFVRYPAEELWMLAAGALWVTLVLVLARDGRRRTLPLSALAAALGGVGGAVVLAAIGFMTAQLERADLAVPGLWGYGVATAFATAALAIVLRSGRAEPVAAAYLLVPAGVTSILLVERVVGPLGPQPLIIGAALASIASTACGVWITATGDALPSSAGARRPRSWRRAVAAALAALALVASIVALATPAMRASVDALRLDGTRYTAAFDVVGLEVAGPWLAFGIALVALGTALEGPVRRRARPRLVALVAAAAVWFAAAPTPLRTLNTFVPSDVQVDYGTEYARITFAGGIGLAAIVAVAAAVLAVVFVWFARSPVAEADPGDGAAPGSEGEYS